MSKFIYSVIWQLLSKTCECAMYTVVSKTDAAYVLIEENDKHIFTIINCDKYYEENEVLC